MTRSVVSVSTASPFGFVSGPVVPALRLSVDVTGADGAVDGLSVVAAGLVGAALAADSSLATGTLALVLLRNSLL